MVFGEIYPDAIPLMKDSFGNYVLQKLFEHGTMAHKKLLAAKMQPCMIGLSKDDHACRVVQTVLCIYPSACWHHC
jgi:hypothetical protein